MSSYVTVVEEGVRVPHDLAEKKKKKKLKKRIFADRLASTDWFSNNVSDHFPQEFGYDDICDRNFEEHAKFCRFLRKVDQQRRAANREFMFYPRGAFAGGQFWELNFPVLDIAQFRAAHHLQKYKRMPTSLFWTDFEHQGCLEDDPLESKFEMIEEMVHELLGKGMEFRDGLADQRMHHQLSHQLARDKQLMEYLKIEERKPEDRRRSRIQQQLRDEDKEIKEESQIQLQIQKEYERICGRRLY